MLRRKGDSWSKSKLGDVEPQTLVCAYMHPAQRKQVWGEEEVEWNRTWRSRIPQIPGVVSGNNGGAREIAQQSHRVYDTSPLRILKPYSLRLNC